MTNPGIAHVPADAIMLMHLASTVPAATQTWMVTCCICPLTPLENWLQERSIDATYTNSFVEHYVVPLIYPTQLTRNGQLALGVAVLVLNASVYWGVIRQRR
jgi:hypothetical protein